MNSFLLPLAQFGGLNGDQIIDDMTTYYLKWGSVGFVLLVLLFFIRYLLRAMVNKKVKGIEEAGMGFMDAESMRKKGLITEEEYKQMRKRIAERELAKTHEAEKGREALKLVSTIEQNPALARTLIELDRAKERPDATAPSASSPRPAPSFVAPRQTLQTDPIKASPAPPQADAPAEPIIPGDPLSDPKYSRMAATTPPPKKPDDSGGKIKDLGQLYAKGLISKEEYDRLSSLFDRE